MNGPHLIFLVWMRSFGNLMLKTLRLGPSCSFDISGKAILGCQYGFQTPNMCSKNAIQWCWNTRICGFVWKCGTQKCQYVVRGNNLTLDGQEPGSSHIQIDLNYFQLLKPIMSFWWKWRVWCTNTIKTLGASEDFPSFDVFCHREKDIFHCWTQGWSPIWAPQSLFQLGG